MSILTPPFVLKQLRFYYTPYLIELRIQKHG